jgi:hypothetical protein
VFITYRTMTSDDTVAYDVAKQEVDVTSLGYVRDRFDEKFITGPEVYQIIKDNLPEYEPSGYLGGSILHSSYKWMAGALVGNRHRSYGSVGKQTMEVAQVGHHLFTGTYLAYLQSACVGIAPFLMSPWDKTVRAAAGNWLRDVIRHPGRLFDSLFIQSIGIIQAPDALPDGRADMCDSCPDMTVYDGKLINSCRMDEYRLFGGLLTVAEKDRAN